MAAGCFAACVRLGRYDQGKQVATVTVSGALSAVGTMIALAYEGNPTKAQGEKTLLPQLAQMMEGWRKEDPPTKGKLPVGIDVPDFLAELGMEKDATEMVKAVVFSLYILLLAVNNKIRLPRNNQLPLPFQWHLFPSPTLPKNMVHQFPLAVFP